MKALLAIAVFGLAPWFALAQKPGPPPAARTPADAQPASDYTPTPEERQLIQLSQEWMDAALVRKDQKRLREIMAPEFTLQIWDASRAPQPLEAWLDTLEHRLDHVQFEYSGLNARVFGDVAVVYSRFWWKGTIDAKPFADAGFLADVWVRRQGQWRVLARRSAPQQQIRSLPDLEAKQ